MAASDQAKLEHTFLNFAKSHKWDEVRFMARETPTLASAHPSGRWSALHHAASPGGSAEMVSFLLAYGANAHLKASDGRSPLDAAASENIKKLLTEGAKAGPERIELEHKFLDLAKSNHWHEVEPMVCKCPGLVNAQPKGRWSALHWAAAAGREDMMRCLLARKADVNAKASDGRTPLDVASDDALRGIMKGTDRGGATATASAKAAMVEVLSSDDEKLEPGVRIRSRSPSKGRARPGVAEESVPPAPASGSACEVSAPPSDAPSPKRMRLDEVASPAPSKPVGDPAASIPPSQIDCAEGKFMLSTSTKIVANGYYVFDNTSRQLSEKGHGVVGTFLDHQISPAAFAEGSLKDAWTGSPVSIKCVSVINSEIIAEVQAPDNAGAIFVLPSQLNGAEYPSERTIIAHLDQYKMDRTGGPRGQLAVHPAAGQFVLRNAACDTRPGGINAVDALMDAIKVSLSAEPGMGYRMHLKNGYLALPDCSPTLQPKVLQSLRRSLHLLRCLGMEDVCACGLDPSLEAASAANHKVSLVYASAVPVQAYLNYGKQDHAFQEEVSRLVLIGQYYGALRLAALRATTASPKRVFLMPLGGGVFNNKSTTIVGAISSAIDLLLNDGWDVQAKLDIRVLTFKGKPSEREEMASLLNDLGKLKVSER